MFDSASRTVNIRKGKSTIYTGEAVKCKGINLIRKKDILIKCTNESPHIFIKI